MPVSVMSETWERMVSFLKNFLMLIDRKNENKEERKLQEITLAELRRERQDVANLLARGVPYTISPDHAGVVKAFEKELKNAPEDVKGRSNVLINKQYENGTVVIWVNGEAEKLLQQSIKNYVLTTPSIGHVRELSKQDFLDSLDSPKDNRVTIIKDLSEEQYNNLTKRIYNNSRTFTFNATVHTNKDGKNTYDVAVKNEHYISGGKKMLGNANMFTTVVTAGVVKNPEGEASIAYDKKLLDKVLNYSGDTPMYVAQPMTAGAYLKVTKDKVEVLDRGDTVRVYSRPEIGSEGFEDKQKSFIQRTVKEFDSLRQPVEINDNIKEIMKSNLGKDIDDKILEQTLSDHSVTGRDSDFCVLKDDRWCAPRPTYHNQSYAKLTPARTAMEDTLMTIRKNAFVQGKTEFVSELSKNMQRLGYEKNFAMAISESANKCLKSPSITKSELAYVIAKDLEKTYGKEIAMRMPEIEKALAGKFAIEPLTNKYIVSETEKISNELKEIRTEYDKLCQETIEESGDKKQKINGKDELELLTKENVKDSELFKEKSEKWIQSTTVAKITQSDNNDLKTVYLKDLVLRDSDGALENLPDDLEKSVADFAKLSVESVSLSRDERAVRLNEFEDEIREGEVSYDTLMRYSEENIEHDNIVNITNELTVNEFVATDERGNINNKDTRTEHNRFESREFSR